MRALSATTMRLLSTRFVLTGLAALGSACPLFACAPASQEAATASPAPDILPLRSLRLYETGVGYFERSGGLAGRATSLPVPASHLDDALASLVVLRGGEGGGQVAGLSFASSVTKATARSSAGLPPDPTSPIAFQDLLESMKGARVAIVVRDTKEAVEGRVVEVAMEVDPALARMPIDPKETRRSDKRLMVTLLTARGDITLVPAETIVRIRPTDPAFAARLDAALDALGTRSTENARSLRLLGNARGPVSFGYVAETPVWRASYRLIAAAGKSTASLQGWALIHNDTDESWHDVHLELVNGEPDSFLFPMAAPRYARRELVHPDVALATLPQLHSTTADAMWGDNLSSGELTGTSSGFGSGHGRLSGSHVSRSPSVRGEAAGMEGRLVTSTLLAEGNAADLAPANGVELGAFFVYAVPNGLSLEAHASGLVPFVQRDVAAERLSFFAHPGAGGRSAVLFVNATGQTLPAGTLSMFSSGDGPGEGGFLGETTLDRLKPGDRRFLQFGNDLDAEVTEKKRMEHDESKRLTFEASALEEHFLRTTDLTWELDNRGGSARAFYVTLQAQQNVKVTGADRLDFDEGASEPIAVFDVKPKDKATRTVHMVEGLSRTHALDALTDKSARLLLRSTTIAPADLAVLQRALPRVAALESAIVAVATAEHTSEVAQQDLERLREDLKALGPGAAGPVAGPLVKRMVEAEDQVGLARKNKEAVAKTLDDRREQLREALRPLKAGPNDG